MSNDADLVHWLGFDPSVRVRFRDNGSSRVLSLADLPSGTLRVCDGAVELADRPTSGLRTLNEPKMEAPMPNVVDLDRMLDELVARSEPSGTAAGQWRVLTRAAEHVVVDVDASNAAATHGVFGIGDAAWDARVEELFADRLALLGRFPLLVETGSSNGIPPVPSLDLPTADEQGGQKVEAPSDAFTVAANSSPTLIDAALYLNVSAQLDAAVPGVVEALMSIAVAAEAESQVVTAIEAGATAATDAADAFGKFTSPLWRPSLLIVPPSGALSFAAEAQALVSLGVDVVIAPSASKMTLVDPYAVVGWLVPLQAMAVEPSVLGKQVARAIWGQLGVTAAAAASFDVPSTP